MPQPTPPQPPRPAAPAAPADTPAAGPQVLVYTPDGALGGTFTCTLCHAQAWQPDLLQHRPTCPFAPGAARR